MRFSLSLAAIITAVSLGSAFAVPVAETAVDAQFSSKVAQGLRLLSLEDGAEPVWKSEDEKLDIMRSGKKFFDVTETYIEDKAHAEKVGPVFKALLATSYPSPSKQTNVKALISDITLSNMQTNLNTLSAYNNRYYRSTTGAQAATWIQTTLKSIASSRSDITVSAFSHSWVQTSTIAKFAGANPSSPVTIIGAHMDSINLNSPTSGRAPGMDDDGSGTVNLIEIFRVLVAAGFKPSTPLEFHFYSGEEGGLLGSKAIASSYNRAGTKVKAMLQLDMTAYFRPGTTEAIYIETDYVDSGLNAWIKKAAAAYTRLPVVEDKCGYACSDHASWNSYGYPSAVPFEAKLGQDNPNIHTSSDTTSVNGFSWSHSLEFTKLGLGYVYEMSA